VDHIGIIRSFSGPAIPPAEVLRDWARCGGMALTGAPGEFPDWAPAGLLLAARDAAARVERGGGPALHAELSGLLFGRAALRGLRRAGQASAGGTCRLLRASDGWVAVNLARPDDLAAVEAIVGDAPAGADWKSAWTALAAAAAAGPAHVLADRAQLLGVPAAALGSATRAPVLVRPGGPRPGRGDVLVVDLSALWAGPLCAHLLSRAGARVIKVEDPRRPDGARGGPAAFFDHLHAGHESRSLDFRSAGDVEALRRLIATADVVIESSRPRALRALGISAEAAADAGTVWVSITGHGREDGNRAAFGDDAAVAGGLVGTDEHGDPVFCGDALADPLTGLHAAGAALAQLRSGRGGLLDVAMSGVAADAARRATALAAAMPSVETVRTAAGWSVRCEGVDEAVRAPSPALYRPIAISCAG
jgi:hypothetical protein